MKAKKSLGQHFLMHARIAKRIVAVSGVTQDSTVFEIGPGRGVLTQEILAVAKRVIALEVDHDMIETLRETFAAEIQNKRLTLIEGDIRTFNLETLPRGYVLVANIPYYLTGEIYRRVFSARRLPSSLTLLVQKEVAERIARSKKESILSLSVKAYGAPRYEFTVPRGAFTPAPKVDSAVLSVTQISRSAFRTAREETRFFDLIHAGFAHKRKLVANNLAPLGITEDRLPKNARAEDLPLSEWLELSRVHR